jgi:hypothetical protein
MQLWIQRANRFNEASMQYRQTHLLPKPEEVGLPVPLIASSATADDSSGVKKDK